MHALKRAPSISKILIQQPKIFAGACCCNYSSSAEFKPILLSKNISYRQSVESTKDGQRPLVLLFSWLQAKSKHIYKYSDFYLGKGFDVLNIKVTPGQLMYPPNTHKVLGEMLDFIAERPKQPILVHGFSVGGYLYGETLVKIDGNDKLYGDIGDSIVGQIIDSGVDMEGIPEGTSKAITQNPVLQKSIQKVLEMYMIMMKNTAVKHYKKSSAAFHANARKVPALVLYSTADPVGKASTIELVMDKWKQSGADVYSKCWNDSGHVMHFLRHQIEYVAELNRFLDNIGLQNSAESDKEILHARV